MLLTSWPHTILCEVPMARRNADSNLNAFLFKLFRYRWIAAIFRRSLNWCQTHSAGRRTCRGLRQRIRMNLLTGSEKGGGENQARSAENKNKERKRTGTGATCPPERRKR